jgi:FMN reductase
MTANTAHIVAVSAGLWVPSKTTELANTILRETLTRVSGRSTLIELATFAKDLGATLKREEASPQLNATLVAIEHADILIAATPVFRGSYTGHFKHLFDLVELAALRGKPVILAATGGGEKHCLTLEYSLKPLFSFFQAFAVPTTVYASEADFLDARLSNLRVHARIQEAVTEAVSLLPPLSSRQFSRPEQAPESQTAALLSSQPPISQLGKVASSPR